MIATTRWRVPLAWLGARLGLYLAGLDDRELGRFVVRRRVMWSALWSTSFVLYMSGTFASAQLEGVGLVLWCVALAGMTASTMANLRLRATLAVALLDRASTPSVAAGVVHHLFVSREGGWPLLLEDRDGTWHWLTGAERDLVRLRASMERRTAGVKVEVRLTVTYYPRTLVIKEVTGLSVEERVTARAPVAAFAPSPS